jgi:polyhydroxyalkanoate synthesis regulator phasin
MFDLIKKTMLTGIGLSLMTKDKVEAFARDMASAAQLPAEKGQQLVDEAIKRAEEGRRDLDQTVQKIVQDALQAADVPTRAQYDALQARVAVLEQKLQDEAAS